MTPNFQAFVANIPRVDNSPRAPCWQQQQIAAQNAYLESVAAGKPKAFIAPCIKDPAAKPPTPSEPKTS